MTDVQKKKNESIWLESIYLVPSEHSPVLGLLSNPHVYALWEPKTNWDQGDECMSEFMLEPLENFHAFLADDPSVPDEIRRSRFFVRENEDAHIVVKEQFSEKENRLLKLYAWLKEDSLESVQADIAEWNERAQEEAEDQKWRAG